jgi:long-chain acyl-CoA synthetase
LLGSQIYYFYPPKEIAQALRKVRPTFFVAVPRFYEKLYHEIQSKIERSKFLPKRIQKLLERWALQRLFPMGAILLSGSAALSTDTQKFFERSGLKILEAYGLTECLLPIAISTPRANRSGSVGKLLYGNQWMLDAESQLLVKGEFLANGYVDGSADRWRSDGYFETGDLISLDAEGFVFIKGRKAFVLKLSTGKKVMRTQIESRFQFRENVDQFCIFGNDKPYLIGLLSLQKAGVSEEWLKQLRSYLVEFNSQVPSHEQVWKVLILDRPLSLAADELTVNLKLRYNKIEEKFKVDLNRLYGDPKPEVLTWLERQAL